MGGTSEPVEQTIRREAVRLGFDAVRFTHPGAIPEAAARLTAFLDDGRHGDMDWMQRHAARRGHPSALWDGARGIIMLAMSYAPEENPLDRLAQTSRGVVSVYAKGRDYHDVLKARIKELARLVATQTGGEVKVFVDTAPLMEKPLAAAAGIGWQGKHTNLVSREHGSWLFLGAILTQVPLAPDDSERDHCGSCTRCLDVCPTQAFPAPYQLDARRCLAYLSIEHKGHIDRSFRAAMGNRVFGCDDCLAVCPWNKFAAAARETRFKARVETDDPPLSELIALDDASFRTRFAGTPVKRTGRDRIVRNALIAAANSGDGALLPQVRKKLNDASPLVRAMAVHALAALAERREIGILARRYLPRERDEGVVAEWRVADTSAGDN